MQALPILAAIALAPPVLQEASAPRHDPPAELFDVVRVVDGDTIWIRRNGDTEKLRLLSVDTEEKLSFHGSATKPGTVYGEETSLWAQELFAGLAEGDAPPRVGLVFPGGREIRDVYGRLLCHVLLPDGTDFNLLLVRQGRSPYFNKYGNSRIADAAFRAAQAEARAAQRGIWTPETNAPATAGVPSARRPYERLLPWWELRAKAVDEFRQEQARDPRHRVACDDPAALEAAYLGDETVRVFGLVERTFEESDGSLTVLMRSGDRHRALRLCVPAESRKAFAEVDFGALNEPYRQNYVWAEGRLQPGGERGGYRLELSDAKSFWVADSDPDGSRDPEDSTGPEDSTDHGSPDGHGGPAPDEAGRP